MSGIVETALSCLGRGFDIACDFRAKYCKGKDRLVMINEEEKVELVVPGFGTFADISVDIKCDKGDRMRFQSDVLEFDRMSELFNHRSSLAGRIPSGLFNSMFAFNGSSWAQDALATKFLAMDGYFISLFNLHIDRRPLILSDHVISAVPSSWDPISLARFIENYGTHIIVGLTVGGQDVIHVRQDRSSNLSPSELKQHLDQVGDQLFTGTCALPPHHWKSKEHRHKVPEAFNVFDQHPSIVDGFTTMSYKDGVTVICSKRGGTASVSGHCEWLLTVPSMPDVINFTLVPITSLLKGVPGTGFLAHAINLYLRYKPPMKDLLNFLDFQAHKAWAPMLNDHPLNPCSNRIITTSALHFNPMGPKLYVNTTQVIVGRQPVTGMRLYLEGRKNNRLAVHLQHLSNTPAFIGNQPNQEPQWRGSESIANETYYEAVQWKMFSHVCTAPVEDGHRWPSADGGTPAFIVTGAQLHVTAHESKSVLHLRLLFSEVPSCIMGQSKWEHCSSSSSHKSSSFFSTISTTFTSNAEKEKQQAAVVVMDSGVFPTGPPVPVHEQKLLKFVDTSQICKGPQDSPGYWLVTGAKLDVEKGKIGLRVKFTLLTLVS